jgi:predicted CopG family antitoxin
MYTTIQVKEETMESLKSLKEREGLKSYDSAIRILLKEGKKHKSMAGTLPRDWDLLTDLRDKHDRY